jgi:hypothetical protein
VRLQACLESPGRQWEDLRASCRPGMSSPLDVAKVAVFAQIVAASVGPFSDVTVNRAVVRSSGTTSRTESGKAQKARNQNDSEDSEDAVGGSVLTRPRFASHRRTKG